MIGLNCRKNYLKINEDIIFERPRTFFIVSVSVIDSEENDNLVALIFPINSKKKSLKELIGLLEARDKLH